MSTYTFNVLHLQPEVQLTLILIQRNLIVTPQEEVR